MRTVSYATRKSSELAAMAANDGSHHVDQVYTASYDFAEAEKLVQKLYLPGSPQEVSRIENVLQRMQRSPQGWQLADVLLQSRDSKVRFFGALTFTIKIKLDWDLLSSEDAALLLDRLLLWVVRLVSAAEGALVLRKACGFLVSYLLRPSVSWELCVRHLLCCFAVGDVVPHQALSQHPPTAELVGRLSQLQLLTSLWFCTGLIEEVSKTDNASVQTHRYHDRVVSDLDDVVLLLQHTVNVESTQSIRVSEEGIKCYQSWVIYAHRAWIDKAIELGPLQVLVPIALNNLTIPDMFDVTAEFFTDVLTNFPAFFSISDFESLATTLSGSSAQAYIATLRAGGFDAEAMAFARLLFAYGDAFVQDLAGKVEDPNSSQIMRQMVELLSCEGSAGAEDEVCSQCLEFWTTFTEFLIDSLYAAGDEIPFWMKNARQYVPEVIEACWKKILMPACDITTVWSPEDRASFSAFRSDVEDLLQSSFTLLGIDIFEQFANLALESLSNRAWLQLEATLFCLNALSDSLPDEESSDGALSRLFGSSLFVDMVGPHSIPSKTRQTAVSSITNYTAFFERHTEFLPPMLNFLFESLKAPPVANVAAKAIYSTCWACRKSLVTELTTFLRQYEILLSWDGVEATTKAKVMGAIAAIIQALPSDEAQMDPLNILLLFVEKDVQSFISLMNAGHHEEAQTHGLCALRCLSYMGKAFQLPDDVTIDLEAEARLSTVWGQPRGELIQGKIIEMIDKVTSLMKGNGDIMEAACQILRTGYKESAPGPFVLPIFVTERFVVSGDLHTARLDNILDTAGALLSRHANSPTHAVSSAALTFLNHLLRLIRMMEGNPSADPEVASSCLNLAEKLIPNYLHTFLDVQTQNDIPALFVFSLRCLVTAELMPKRAASYFWASFIQTRELPEEIQSVLYEIMQTYGSQLSYALIINIGGGAARSDLDVLAEPLKRLVSLHPRAKTWLTEALWSESFPSQKVSAAEKRIWLQKIMSLRGAKGTNQAVKEFWMACRGTNLSYAS